MRKILISNAKAYNRHLTDKFFESKTSREIIPFCHPSDRADFLRLIEKGEKK